MHFPADHPKFEWRLNYFRAMVLPRIQAQQGDFKIAIRCNPVHVDLFKSLDERIITFGIKPQYENFMRPRDAVKAKRYFVDFAEYRMLEGLPRFDIQMAMDSDDMPLGNDYVLYIQSRAQEAPQQSMYIGFDPYMFQVDTLRTYKCHIQYNAQKGSPIFALYQPKEKEQYYYAYHKSHLTIGHLMDRQLFEPPGRCAFSIHKNNSSTYLHRNANQVII